MRAGARAQVKFSDGKTKTAGSIGDIGCFSFYPQKTSGIGRRGIITTDNEDIYKKS